MRFPILLQSFSCKVRNMAPVTFEQGVELKEISEVRPSITPDPNIANEMQNCFRSLQTPWTWPGSKVVPGGLLMALAANAAYHTTAEGFAIDTLQCHFLAAPRYDVPFDAKVQRLTDGGRFCSRVVHLEQEGSLKVFVSCSFVRPKLMSGPSMTHAMQRQSGQTIDSITLDDLARERSDIGPYVKFQRLPLLWKGSGPQPTEPPPESLLYTSVGQVSPQLINDDVRMHSLALIALSDYHILDCPPTVHGHSLGSSRINDAKQALTSSDFDFMTSLNHTIRFHVHDGYRADDLIYVEAMTPWTKGRRAEVDSRLFTPSGKLLATCTQEVYFVMKQESQQNGSRHYVMEERAIASSKL